MLKDAGFCEVIAEDRTEQVQISSALIHILSVGCFTIYIHKLIQVVFTMFQFIKVLQREMDAVEKNKDEFIQDFSEVGSVNFFFLLWFICGILSFHHW